MQQQWPSYNWTKSSTLTFIRRRILEDENFNGRPNSATIGYTNIIRDLNIPITERQARSKWQNLVYKYKEMKRYLDGSKKGFRKACNSWPYFKVLDDFLTHKLRKKATDDENFHEGMVNALSGNFRNEMMNGGGGGGGENSAQQFDDTSWIKSEVVVDEDSSEMGNEQNQRQHNNEDVSSYHEQILNDFGFEPVTELRTTRKRKRLDDPQFEPYQQLQVPVDPPPLVYTQHNPPPLAVIEFSTPDDWSEKGPADVESSSNEKLDFEKSIRKELNNLKSSVHMIQLTTANLERKMDIIISHLERQYSTEIETKYTMPNFPITTPVELKKLSDDLVKDKPYLSQVGLFLAHLMPSNEGLNETVKNILEYICPYELICLYTWTGVSVIGNENSKLAFNELVGIQELIKYIVKTDNDADKEDDNNILRSMAVFMKRSTQRRDREMSKRLRSK